MLATKLAVATAGGLRSLKSQSQRKNGGAPHGLATRPADTLAGGLRTPLRRRKNSGAQSHAGERPPASMLAGGPAGGECPKAELIMRLLK